MSHRGALRLALCALTPWPECLLATSRFGGPATAFCLLGLALSAAATRSTSPPPAFSMASWRWRVNRSTLHGDGPGARRRRAPSRRRPCPATRPAPRGPPGRRARRPAGASRSATLTSSYSRRKGLLKPNFGRRRWSGICPPSKPSKCMLPVRAFWPLPPRPAVLPRPERLAAPDALLALRRAPGRLQLVQGSWMRSPSSSPLGGADVLAALAALARLAMTPLRRRRIDRAPSRPGRLTLAIIPQVAGACPGARARGSCFFRPRPVTTQALALGMPASPRDELHLDGSHA